METFIHQFFQQLINGVSLGSIYALIALGYTMIYGIIKLINFAHGDIFMLGCLFWLLRYYPIRLAVHSGNYFLDGRRCYRRYYYRTCCVSPHA